MKRRVYISGKITGMNRLECKVKFLEAQSRLEEMGYKVINPILLADYNLSHVDFMKIDYILLDSCSAIYMLDNWQKSIGARIEHDWAKQFGLDVMYEGGGDES